MTCKNCGSQITENEAKCTKCGTPTSAEELDLSAAGAERAVPRGFSAKKNIIIIIIAAVLLIGGGITAIAVTNSSTQRAHRTLMLAERYLSEQNYEQAVIEFQKTLEIEPMNVDAYLELSKTYIKLGDQDKALAVLRVGLQNTGDERIRRKIAEFTEPITIRGEELYIVSTEKLIIINKVRCENADDFNTEVFHERVAEGYKLIYIDYNLSENEVKELGRLTNLKCLDVEFAGLSNIEALANLTELTLLDISFNDIRDISPLANLPNLRELYLPKNRIIDISSLRKQKKLTYLNLSGNNIRDISPIENLKNLIKLRLPGFINNDDLDRLKKRLPNCEIEIINDISNDIDYGGGSLK